MAQNKRFDARLNVYVSTEVQRKLEQIRDQRGPQTTVPDIVREAIRSYIDNEEEIIGSRRHFQRNLRDTVDATKFQLLWSQVLTLAFVWQSISPVVSVATKQTPQFRDIFQRALEFAIRNWDPMITAMSEGAQGAFDDIAKKEEK
jgi:hypothetical protein